MVEEFLGLERDSNGKIDHPDGGSTGSKDMVDAICGSVYNASQNAEQYAFDFGETLETIVGVSKDATSAANQQKQLTVEFEQELQKLLDPMSRQVQQTQNSINNTSNKPAENPAKFIKDNSNNNSQTQSEFRHLDFGMGPAQVYKPAYLNQGIIYW